MRPQSEKGESIFTARSLSRMIMYFSGVILFSRLLMFFCFASSSGRSEISFPRCRATMSQDLDQILPRLHLEPEDVTQGLLIKWTVSLPNLQVWRHRAWDLSEFCN